MFHGESRPCRSESSRLAPSSASSSAASVSRRVSSYDMSRPIVRLSLSMRRLLLFRLLLLLLVLLIFRLLFLSRS